MSFIKKGSSVISFADASDVEARDQRIFDQNEGLTTDIIEAALIRATERILFKIKSTNWWKDHYGSSTVAEVNPTLIINRKNDFTDLCVYQALAEFILPLVADFDSVDNSERSKMAYYTSKADALFIELITAGDWYDFNADGVITTDESTPGAINLKRIR
jgi:hypothetical protein